MGAVEFREAYGELPATQIPKLPFYGGITILYAVVAVYVFPFSGINISSSLMISRFWGFLYYQHRYDIRK